MKTSLALALVAVALAAGCVSQHDAEMAELQACGRLNHTPAYDPCIERYNARTNQRLSEAQAAQPVNGNSDGAAMLLLGATALMNGYNSGQSGPMPMVNVGGHMTMCSGASGMMQCY